MTSMSDAESGLEKKSLLGESGSTFAYYSYEESRARVFHFDAGLEKSVHATPKPDIVINGENVTSKDKDEEEKFSFRRLSSRSKYTLLMLALSILFSELGPGIIAPFYPDEARRKGASSAVIGCIFSIYQFTLFISSPIFGNYLARIGAKFMFMAGICVGGTSAILFGLLDHCPAGTPFITMSFLLRFVEALGMSAYVNACYAIASSEFPKYVGSIFGILKVANGIGMMVGPAVGGGLYEFGGYGLPFFVVGSLILLNGILVYRFLPSPEGKQEHTRTKSAFCLLKSPMVWVTIVTIMACNVGDEFLNPTLARHLNKFNLTPGMIGLVFTVIPVFYGTTCPLWGYFSDSKKIHSPIVILIFGNFVLCVSFMFIGPSPLLPFLPFELWTIILGLVVYGMCLGSVMVPTMKCLVIGALEIGFEDNIDTYGIVSGLFNSVLPLGAIPGLTFGGIMVDEFGFGWAAMVISACYFLAMLSAVVYHVYRKITGVKTKDLSDEFLHSSLPTERCVRRGSVLCASGRRGSILCASGRTASMLCSSGRGR